MDDPELAAAHDFGRRVSRVRGAVFALFTVVALLVGMVAFRWVARLQLLLFGHFEVELTIVLAILPPLFVCLAIASRVNRRIVGLRVREWAAEMAARHRVPVAALDDCVAMCSGGR